MGKRHHRAKPSPASSKLPGGERLTLWDFFQGRGSPQLGPELMLEWSLRLACCFCFVGHGAWGIVSKFGWLPFFHVFAIPSEWAWSFMPLVGTMDILMGLSVLVLPTRAVLAWMAVWCLFTASLRPLAGKSIYEFFERAGNFGPPLLYYFWATRDQPKLGWLERIPRPRLTPEFLHWLDWGARLAVAGLLLGHAGFCLDLQKTMLIKHLGSVLPFVPGTLQGILRGLGMVEVLLAFLVLGIRSPRIWSTILIYKLLQELLYVPAGEGIFETVERAGDYFLPLTLLAIHLWESRKAAELEASFEPSSAPNPGWVSWVAPALAAGILGMVLLQVARIPSPYPFHLKPRAGAEALPLLEVGAPRSLSDLAEVLDQGGVTLYLNQFESTQGPEPAQRFHGRFRLRDFEDCSWQRSLSPAARREARELGQVLGPLAKKKLEIFSSPYCRVQETVALLLGREPDQRIQALLYETHEFPSRRGREALGAWLKTSVPEGTLRVLAGHGSFLGELEPLKPGEILVIEPDSAAPRLLGRVLPEEWPRLLRAWPARSDAR